jgi:hypothetical protein
MKKLAQRTVIAGVLYVLAIASAVGGADLLAQARAKTRSASPT